MQHIPDREFDNLFRDTFKDAEVEPSPNLWASIEKELAPKQKKKIPLFWMAAAAVTVTVSAMLLFQEKEVVRLQGTQDPTIAVEQPAIRVQEDNSEIITVKSATPVAIEQTERPAVRKVQAKQEIVAKPEIENTQNIQIAVQPNNNPDRLPIKSMDPRPLDVTPIKETAVVENPVVYVYNPVNDTQETVIAENNSERKGIRNVGDLVNYVVEKVDKREKKLLRFNTDDDNSSIIGINIGFLKFNKKNR